MHISCLASSAQCSICDSHQYYIQFWLIFFFLLFLNIELWSTLVLVHFSLLQNCRTRLRCIYLLHCSWIVGRVPSRQCCCNPLCACMHFCPTEWNFWGFVECNIWSHSKYQQRILQCSDSVLHSHWQQRRVVGALDFHQSPTSILDS